MKLLKCGWTFLLLFCGYANATQPADPSCDIILGLQAIGTVNQSRNSCPGVTQSDSNLPLKRSGGTLDLHHQAWPGEFCLQVMKACAREFGDYKCAGSLRHSNERLNNWKRLARQADEIHRSHLGSEKTLTLCCKDNRACKRLLASTKFLVELESSGDFPDQFDQGTRTIRLNAKTLSKCSNIECLEEIYLHELGHACQRAIVLSSNQDEIGLPSASCTMRAMPKLETYVRYFGPEKARCVWLKVKAQLERNRIKDVCPDQWYDEAIASVIFGDFFRSPMHFQRVCRSPADQAHPELDFMIGCMPLKR